MCDQHKHKSHRECINNTDTCHTRREYVNLQTQVTQGAECVKGTNTGLIGYRMWELHKKQVTQTVNVRTALTQVTQVHCCHYHCHLLTMSVKQKQKNNMYVIHVAMSKQLHLAQVTDATLSSSI